MPIIEILTYVSFVTGGILVLLLVLSIFSGLDFDFDLPSDVSVETDSGGGFGILKSFLTFISISTYVIKVLMALNYNLVLALVIGASSGVVAVLILANLMLLLIGLQENVNWEPLDGLYKEAVVYLKIPAEGSGIIKVEIAGGIRELKAVTKNSETIETGQKVRIDDFDENQNYAVVSAL